MAARPFENLSQAIIKEYTVGTTATKGKAAKIVTADDTATNVTATSDIMIGVWLDTAAAAAKARVALKFTAVVQMLVGTGGATRGAQVQYVADGITDWAAGKVIGIALQTGVAGDYISVGLCEAA